MKPTKYKTKTRFGLCMFRMPHPTEKYVKGYCAEKRGHKGGHIRNPIMPDVVACILADHYMLYMENIPCKVDECPSKTVAHSPHIDAACPRFEL